MTTLVILKNFICFFVYKVVRVVFRLEGFGGRTKPTLVTLFVDKHSSSLTTFVTRNETHTLHLINQTARFCVAYLVTSLEL